MSKTVNLARGLTLPAAELATSVTALLGIRGSGKTNAAVVITEGLLDAEIPVIILDRVGIWFGLRLAADGKQPSGYKIPVLGGAHGDIALSPMAGAQVAEALAASHSSAVLDISRFSKGDRVRFATEFAEAFFEAKKRHVGPVLLVLEEAQRYIPQVIRFSGTGLERCLGAFEEIAEQGRNYGVGLLLLSLRPEKLNKDVVNLAENVFGFRALGVHERKAVAEWVQEKGAEGRDDVKNELPALPEGTAIVWSPVLFKLYGKYHFKLKNTYDAGKTPDRIRAAVKVKPLDLAELEAAMGKAVDDAKANDPKMLRARIAELERLNARLKTNTLSAGPTVEPRIVEKPMLKPADLIRLERLIDKLGDGEERFKKIGLAALDVARDVLAQSQQAVVSELGNLKMAIVRASIPQAPSSRPAFVDPGRGPRQARVVEHAPKLPDGALALSRCARALLSVLAVRGHASDSQLSALSGYRKTSSGFANALSELRTKALIDDGPPERRGITSFGRETVGEVAPLPKGRALLDYWLSKLSRAEAAMLKVIYERGSVDREDLSRETGYSQTSSGFANAISGLRVLELVSGPNGGDLTIADVFRE